MADDRSTPVHATTRTSSIERSLIFLRLIFFVVTLPILTIIPVVSFSTSVLIEKRKPFIENDVMNRLSGIHIFGTVDVSNDGVVIRNDHLELSRDHGLKPCIEWISFRAPAGEATFRGSLNGTFYHFTPPLCDVTPQLPMREVNSDVLLLKHYTP